MQKCALSTVRKHRLKLSMSVVKRSLFPLLRLQWETEVCLSDFFESLPLASQFRRNVVIERRFLTEKVKKNVIVAAS